MIDRFIDLQEKQLEKLGAERVQEQSRLDLEKQRLEGLHKLKESMTQNRPESALLLQNRAGLRGQIDNLIGMQEHELAAANANLDYKSKSVINQFGKVKAFQAIERRRAAIKNARERRREQSQADDWISQSHRRA